MNSIFMNESFLQALRKDYQRQIEPYVFSRHRKRAPASPRALQIKTIFYNWLLRLTLVQYEEHIRL